MDIIKYGKIIYHLNSLMRSQWKNFDDLKKLQEKKMRGVIRHAYYNIPFYRKKFKKAGIKPDDIKKVEDLKKLPITTKQEIQEAFPHEIVWDKVDLSKAWKPKTGGSTGIPLTMVYDANAEAFQKAVALRANFSVGQKITDRWAILTSPGHFRKPLFIQKIGILPTYYISIFEDISKQLEILNQVKPAILDGYASSIWILSKYILENDVTPQFSPRIIFTTAELLDPPMREDIQQAFPDAEIFDQFGCVELGRTAWECEEHEGYHIDVEAVVMEFIKDGEQVWSGERGEIVYTGLYNYAMPLIRYAINDIGVPEFNEKPSCGRGLPLMKLIEGRKDDFIILPDGEIISPRTISVLMKRVTGIQQYLFIQEDYTKFTLKIVPRVVSTINKEYIMSIVYNTLKNTVMRRYEFELKIEVVNSIERQNKLRKVISKVKR